MYEKKSFVGRPFSLFVATLGTTEFLPDRFAYQEDAPRSIRGRYIRLRSDAKKSLYNYRAEKLSRPASTMKLLTAITALSRPEAAEPFRTEVWHDGVIEHDTLQGNLYVVGGFDPEFNSQSMDSLIEEVITFPFSVINGQVYGDVSMKDSLYWGSGWAWDDTPAGYQPICLH